jgi:small subunit ribosomal protein S27Ae
MAKKEKKTRKKGKRTRKGRKHESIKVNKYYGVKGENLERSREFCPRCGPGVWLSKHKERLYCGKCGYTSIGGKKPPEETKPEEKRAEEGKEPAKEEEKESKE